MKLLYKITFLFSFIFSQSIQISVDNNQIEEGDLINLSVEAIGSKDFPQVDLTVLKPAFEILGGPSQQTNIQFINGRRSSTKTISWTITPQKSGKIYIPALSGLIDGKKFEGKRIPINVIKVNDTSNKSLVFIKTDIDKKSAFLGEQITLSYKLYKQTDVNITSIDQFEMPDFPGFWVEELFNPKRLQYQKKIEIVNGIKYQVAVLGQRGLFPIGSKKHVIPSVQVKLNLEVKNKRNNRDPFFDPFFNSFFSETKTKILNSEEQKISIKSFPRERPKDFFGAVGDFEISSSSDVGKIKINEGVTFNITLKGTGNLSLFTFPELKFPDYIEVFQPNETFEKDVFRNKLTGKKSLEYILIPRKSGNIILPEVSFTYFNLENKKWTLIKTKPLSITVEDDKNPYKIENLGYDKPKIKIIDRDIRYLSYSFHYPLIPDDKFLVIFLYTFSFFIFLIPFLIKRFKNIRLVKKIFYKEKNALNIAYRVLNNEKQDLYQRTSLSLYLFLENKLNLKSGNLDSGSIKLILKGRVEPELIEKVVSILEVCDEANYSSSSIKLDPSIINKMQSLIRKLNEVLK